MIIETNQIAFGDIVTDAFTGFSGTMKINPSAKKVLL